MGILIGKVDDSEQRQMLSMNMLFLEEFWLENGFTHRFGIHQTVCKSYHTYFPTANAISTPIGKKDSRILVGKASEYSFLYKVSGKVSIGFTYRLGY